jgi:hypothetical protein
MNIYWLLFIIMKIKKYIQKALDTTLKSKIKKTFGEKSFVKINNVSKVRSKNSYLFNVTLYIDDIENGLELYPDGLDVIIKQAWDMVGDKTPIIAHYSLDVP